MEVHEIRYFLALTETLNFTRAAEQCHVSQPALTRAIKSLEEKLGAGPLISRERHNTHLTEVGRMMRPYFQQVLHQLQEAKSKAQSYVRLDGSSLRIGLMCTLGPVGLIGLFTDFANRYEGVDIHLQDGPVDLLEERLGRGDIDIAVYCRPEQLDDRFHTLALFKERFVVALAPGHRLASFNGVRMRDLNGESYLGRANCEYYEHLRAARERMGGIDFQRPYTSDRDDWIQSMVLANLGFTYIPEFAVTLPALVTRPLIEPEVWRTVQLVTVRGRPHSPAVGAFVGEARRYAWQGKVPALSQMAQHAATQA
jgi:DNA-binding transcriptional LysR family regulator